MAVETEAKLHASRRAFADIARASELAGWHVRDLRDVALRDTYWDTPGQHLARARCTLRVREIDGGQTAELTLKGPVPSSGGATRRASMVWSRDELTAAVPAGSRPAEWARLPTARPVVDALAPLTDLDDLRPDVVLLNPRHEMVLEGEGSRAVLSLDEVAVEGSPYRRRYVEVELASGSPEALHRLVSALAPLYGLRPARQGKVQAARVWLSRQRPNPVAAAPGAPPGHPSSVSGLRSQVSGLTSPAAPSAPGGERRLEGGSAGPGRPGRRAIRGGRAGGRSGAGRQRSCRGRQGPSLRR